VCVVGQIFVVANQLFLRDYWGDEAMTSLDRFLTICNKLLAFIELCIDKRDDVESKSVEAHACSSCNDELIEEVHISQYALVEKRAVNKMRLQPMLDQKWELNTVDMLNVEMGGSDEFALNTIFLNVFASRFSVERTHRFDLLKWAAYLLMKHFSRERFQLSEVQEVNRF